MEVAAFWIAPRSCVTLTREAISSFCGCHGKQCDTENKVPHSAGVLHETITCFGKSHDDGQKLSKPTVFGAPSSPLSFDSERYYPGWTNRYTSRATHKEVNTSLLKIDATPKRRFNNQ
jgi:hypothetical protein